MAIFLGIAAVFFVLLLVFFSSAGGIFTALWLSSIIGAIVSGAILLSVSGKGKGKKKIRIKPQKVAKPVARRATVVDAEEEDPYLFYEIIDDDF